MSLAAYHERLNAAGSMLEQGEREIAEACGALLLNLSDVMELPPGTVFFDANAKHSAELAQRAAKAAMAVLLSDRNMSLPHNIEVAYDMPEMV